MVILILPIILSIVVIIFTLPFLVHIIGNKNGVPRNWPVLGMLPAIIANSNNILEWGIMVANENKLSTLMVNGPWLSNIKLLVTAEPVNVQYTSSSRFSNFPRGPKSREMFDVFGEGLLNVDGKEWEAQRKIHRAFFGHKEFNERSTEMAFEKVESGIVVVLDHVAGGGHVGSGSVEDDGVIDLQELFLRYTYDLTYKLVVGSDPKSLSLEWNEVISNKALNSAMQSVWLRHFLPEPYWKLLRRLDVGHEKTLKKAKDILHKFTNEIVATKHDEFNSHQSIPQREDNLIDILTTYFREEEHNRSRDVVEVLKDNILVLFLAGNDTTASALTWFFWIVSQHPSVEARVRVEVAQVILEVERERQHVFTPNEISNLVYLHACVYETLRLYPPIPYQTRSAREPDRLPSGHEVIPNSTMVLIPLYMMARLKSVWGYDCKEFKPERWIGENGGFKHEPSHKFFTFNSGPRICLGKEVALTQIKVAIATILYNYNVHALEQQEVVPTKSVVLQTKYGLKAKIGKRWT